MKEYRKTYKPFIYWMIGMVAGLLALSILPDPFIDGDSLLRLVMLGVLLSLDILMAIIYFGEYVYWINGGPTYEQARDAGSDARKAYARAHLRAFLLGTWLAVIAMAAAYICKWSTWVDICAVCIAMVAAAISTIHIKFQ